MIDAHPYTCSLRDPVKNNINLYVPPNNDRGSPISSDFHDVRRRRSVTR